MASSGSVSPNSLSFTGREQRKLLPKQELMEFDLLTYRFGALATLFPEAAERLTVPSRSDLVRTFREQQGHIQVSAEFEAARRLIEDTARSTLDRGVRYSPGSNERAAQANPDLRDLVSIPPPFGIRRQRPSSHLAAVFPRDRLTLQLGRSRVALRIRASVTACALEVADGFPKLWWTFEAVPENPEQGNVLSLSNAARLLKFARSVEQELLDLLKKVYFDSLALATDNAEKLDGELLDRLRIRCVETRDETVGALIDALQFRVKSPKELRGAEGPSLKQAKRGLVSFETFVNGTNEAVASAIDPDVAQAETRLFGVQGITARQVVDRDVSIAAIAQIPVEPTPYDRLESVRERRLSRRSENNLLDVSPARRLSAELANDAAQELDDLRHSLSRRVLTPAPA